MGRAAGDFIQGLIPGFLIRFFCLEVRMSRTNISLPQRSFGETSRIDAWWSQPLIVFLGLLAFVVYSTWAAFQGAHYSFGAYLSPMYSPLFFEAYEHAATGHALFGDWPKWLPAAVIGIPLTPAFLILWAPGGFRFTCYYYRGAYYKAFWGDPSNCGVGEWRKGYRGERWFPLVFQNIHRYFLYFAILFIFVLTYDAFMAMWHAPDGMTYAQAKTDSVLNFGIKVGTLVLIINPILLGGYTFGCHSLRHLIGGFMDKFSGNSGRKKAYDCVSCLNRGHAKWAWASLIWVGFTDLYVRLCSMGVWTDWTIIG